LKKSMNALRISHPVSEESIATYSTNDKILPNNKPCVALIKLFIFIITMSQKAVL